MTNTNVLVKPAGVPGESVLATHAEGSLDAEKLQILRSYDWARPRTYVSELIALRAAVPLG